MLDVKDYYRNHSKPTESFLSTDFQLVQVHTNYKICICIMYVYSSDPTHKVPTS